MKHIFIKTSLFLATALFVANLCVANEHYASCGKPCKKVKKLIKSIEKKLK